MLSVLRANVKFDAVLAAAPHAAACALVLYGAYVQKKGYSLAAAQV
jgi:hypothetical protein